jgi:hypothetical protein
MVDYKNIFVEVLQSHGNAPKWTGATFGGIKTLSNTKVGSVGQDFIEKLCHKLNLECIFPVNAKGKRASQSPWDIQINGIKFELKTATEDINDHFQFNHVRYHRPYDALLCLGVSPERLCFGIWSKADVATGKAGNLVSMEKGANASYKLTKSYEQLDEVSVFYDKLMQFTADYKNRS